MKRAIFAVIFCLAAAGTAAAADDTLAGLIQAGNRDAALARIAAGADVNAAQGDGTTPLHWAVYKIDADLARALLERGAKPDVVNSYGSSPLAEAVKVANARLVELLLADFVFGNQLPVALQVGMCLHGVGFRFPDIRIRRFVIPLRAGHGSSRRGDIGGRG